MIAPEKTQADTQFALDDVVGRALDAPTIND
jgi:hypothetical protein